MSDRHRSGHTLAQRIARPALLLLLPAWLPWAAAQAIDAPATGAAALPYELRQIAQRYPVTLYTTSDCEPCDRARALLRARGVPFAERTVTTAGDGLALQRLSGDTTLPLLTIGAQQLKGFTEDQWQRYLDAAGYPARPQLPPGYRAPAPAPLAEASAPRLAPPPVIPPPAATPAAPDNPAGIVF